MEDFAQYDAVGLAELIRCREVTALELVDEVIDRIERVNPTLNGVTIKMYDHARELAQGDIGNGPLAGVPFLLKDFLAEYAGVEYSASSRFLQGFVPDTGTPSWSRGSRRVDSSRSPRRTCRSSPSARRPSRDSGERRTIPGTPHGRRAVRAAGQARWWRRGSCPWRTGNDAGGSIRIPAAACGTVGLKPTRGRNPLGPYFGEVFSGFVAEHVLTRTVRDTAAVLDITAGPDVGDWYPAPPQTGSYLDEVGTPPGRLRIAFSAESPTGTEVHPDCANAVRDIAALCEELGHDVVERSPEYDEHGLWLDWTTMMSAGVAWGVHGWEERVGRKAGPEDLEPFIAALVERGDGIGAPAYLGHLERLQLGAREIGKFFTEHDVWLTPTLGEPSPAARRPHLRQRRPVRAATTTGDVLAVHVYRECDRTAGDFVAARLERRQPAHRHPLPRTLRRRGDALTAVWAA